MRSSASVSGGLFLVLTALFCISPAQAESVSPVRADTPPVIDGDLSDACWRSCDPLPFVRYPTGEQPERPTRARVCRDDAWLYVVFECDDPSLKPAQMVDYRVDGPITASDCVEVFIDPGTQARMYYHFAADRFGQQMDKLCKRNEWTGEYDSDLQFNAHWRSAGKETADGYAVEIAIPLTYIAEHRLDDADVRINFCRTERDGANDFREYTQWTRTKDTFHDPVNFGTLADFPTDVAPVFMPVLYGVRLGVMTDYRGGNEYPVLVGVRNDSNTGGTIHLRVTDVKPEGGRHLQERDVRLGAKDNQVLSFEMRNTWMVDPEPDVMVSIEDELGEWRVSMANLMGRFDAGEQTLDAYLDRNYYTTESAARLYYTILRTGQELATLSVEVTVADGQLFKTDIARPAADEQVVEITLDDLPAGAHALHLRVLSQGGQPVDEARLQLIKREPLVRGTEVKVDRYNRCVLVNGERFFPFAPVALRPNVPWFAGAGFNMIFRWGGSYDYDPAEDLDKDATQIIGNDPLLAAAQEHDMLVLDRFRSYVGGRSYGVFRSLRSSGKRQPTDVYEEWFAALGHLIPAVRNHPAYFGACPFDEPADIYIGTKTYSELSQQVNETIRRLDGYHPVFDNWQWPVPIDDRWKDHQDLLSYYDYTFQYPRGGMTTSHRVRVCNERAVAQHLPLFAMPQSGEWADVPLSCEEQFANTWIMMTGGARSLFFFTWPITHIATYRTMQELGERLDVLAPALTLRRPEQEIETPGVDLRNRAVDAALLNTPEGGLILMAVNKTYSPVDVRFRLDWLEDGQKLVRLFGPKTALAAEGRIAAERLEPLATRAWRIDGVAAAARPDILRVVIEEERTGPVQEPEDDNLIANGGFESSGDFAVHPGADNMAFDAAEKHAGEQSLRLMRNRGDSTVIVSGEPVTLRKGHEYMMEGYLKLHVDEFEKPGRYSGVCLMIKMPAGADHNDAVEYLSESSREWVRVSERIDEIEKDITVTPQIRLRNVYGTAWVDDFTLTDLGGLDAAEQGASRNLVPNSSFEQTKLDNWPVRWRADINFDFGENLMGTPDAPWVQDDSEAWHGDGSLRIAGGNAPKTFTWYYRYNVGIRAQDGKPYTFSAYMKSDRPGAVVNVDVRGIGDRDFTLTDEWRRYTLTGAFEETDRNNSTTAVIFDVSNAARGSHVWIDAVQLEQGAKATEYTVDAYRLEE